MSVCMTRVVGSSYFALGWRKKKKATLLLWTNDSQITSDVFSDIFSSLFGDSEHQFKDTVMLVLVS